MPPALSRRGEVGRDRPPPSSGLRRSRTSNSRMKRVAAIQKSSRTMTMHCTRPPSHCRRACTSSVFSSSFLACSHCSNWSRTISTFLPDGNALAPAQGRQRLLQAQVGGQGRTAFPQAVQQAGFGFLGGRFDVDGDHVVGQPGQQARLHQRRLAAARWPVDQAHGERVVGVRLLDAGLPEANAVGQSVPVARAGQQFEEEVGIVGVEGPQALRHDLDGLAGPRSASAADVANRSRCRRWRSCRRRRAPANAAACSASVGLLGQKVPQVVGHVLGRRVPLRGPLRQGLQADAFQFLRDAVVASAGAGGPRSS